MNLISFSVYGNSPKYLIGAVRNAQFVTKVMDGWSPIFFLDNDIPASLAEELIAEGALVRMRGDDWHPNGMFWRFRAFFEKGADRVLIRDSDSRIGPREILAIDLWVRSGKGAHIIRDHPLHQSLILGGMWGAAASLLKERELWFQINQFGTKRGSDQDFLNQFIYPVLKDEALIHDSFFHFEANSSRIPMMREFGEFIGEVIDENERFDSNSRAYLSRIESSRLRSVHLKLVVYIRFAFVKLKSKYRIKRSR